MFKLNIDTRIICQRSSELFENVLKTKNMHKLKEDHILKLSNFALLYFFIEE